MDKTDLPTFVTQLECLMSGVDRDLDRHQAVDYPQF